MLPILIALVLGSLQAAVSKEAFDLKELYRLEAVWNDAHVKGDADTLDTLWADDLILTIAAMPAMKKADALAMVRSNRMPFTKYRHLGAQREALRRYGAGDGTFAP